MEHERENYANDVAPIVDQKLETFNHMADKFLVDIQNELKSVNEEEEATKVQIAALVKKIDALKSSSEKEVAHWAKEEEKAVLKVNQCRASTIKTTRQLLHEQESEASKQHQQQSIHMLTALRGLR